jgi:hypothetical protein
VATVVAAAEDAAAAAGCAAATSRLRTSPHYELNFSLLKYILIVFYQFF